MLKRKISILVCVLLATIVFSVTSFAQISSVGLQPGQIGIAVQEVPTVKIIKGAENIKKYEEDNYERLNSARNVVAQSPLINKTLKTTKTSSYSFSAVTYPPTSIWYLNDSSRSTGYYMKEYIYSGYAYRPYTLDGSISICHKITPDQSQKLRIQIYKKSTNMIVYSCLDTFSSTTYIEVNGLSATSSYYVKYTSVDDVWISADLLIY